MSFDTSSINIETFPGGQQSGLCKSSLCLSIWIRLLQNVPSPFRRQQGVCGPAPVKRLHAVVRDLLTACLRVCMPKKPNRSTTKNIPLYKESPQICALDLELQTKDIPAAQLHCSNMHGIHKAPRAKWWLPCMAT